MRPLDAAESQDFEKKYEVTKEFIREGGFIQFFATETAVIFEALFGTRQLNFGMLQLKNHQ